MTKEEIKEINSTTWVRKTTTIGSFVLGWLLVFFGFFAPPLGVIDNSVIIIFGQVMMFVGCAIGLKSYADISIARIEELNKKINKDT